MTTIAHGHTPGRFGSVRPGGSLMARGPNERYLFLKAIPTKMARPPERKQASESTSSLSPRPSHFHNQLHSKST